MFKNLLSKKLTLLVIFNLAISIVFLVVVVFVLMGIIPNVIVIYQEFGADLPLITRMIFNIVSIFQRLWYIIVPVLALISIVLSVVLAWILRKMDSITIIVLYVGVLFIGIAGVIVLLAVGVYSPLLSLTNQL